MSAHGNTTPLPTPRWLLALWLLVILGFIALVVKDAMEYHHVQQLDREQRQF